MGEADIEKFAGASQCILPEESYELEISHWEYIAIAAWIMSSPVKERARF